MTKRISYDMVEAKAVKLRQAGHDVALYFNFEGHIHVSHNGEDVLVDKGRDYILAFAALEQISDGKPALEPNAFAGEKDVRRGKPKARSKTKAKKNA